MRKILLSVIGFLPLALFGQTIEKHPFNGSDYYLFVKPQGPVKATLVLLTNFPAESIPPETKLHGVAYINNVLTVYCSLPGFVADSANANRISHLLSSIAADLSADTASFVLGGFGFAGNIALRYTEYCYAQPGLFPIKPKAVFTIGSFVDLPELYDWCNREIKKNYYRGNVGDGQFLLNYFKRLNPAVKAGADLAALTPFSHTDTLGNERWLAGLPVRLYYDGDWLWDLQRRHNSLYDNPIAGGSELISRLLQSADNGAELILSKQPGYRGNGIRNPVSLSIVDESDCIQWIMTTLNILNPALPQLWKAPYTFPMPAGWTMERTDFPPAYSPNVPYKGFEEIHFPPGWGDASTEDYWTVSYLFRLEGKQPMDAARLQDFINVYYEGLIADNVLRRNIPKEKLVPVSAKLAPAKTEKGDSATFTGSVSSFDWLAQAPILLHCRVHIKPGGDNFTPLLIEFSPKPFEHAIWQKMEVTTEQFQCGTGKAQ
jgi:hypothetical protein